MVIGVLANMFCVSSFAQISEAEEVTEQRTLLEKVADESVENPFQDIFSEDSTPQSLEELNEEFAERYLGIDKANRFLLKQRDLLIADELVSPETLLERYPAGSIVSREQAEKALSEVEKGKRRIDAIFQRDEFECYDKFFTNMCIKDVKMARHKSWNQIKPIKIEADIFIRQDKVKERDAKLGDRKEGDAVSPEERAKNQADYAKRQKDRAEARERVQKKHEKTAERRKRKAEDERKEQEERARRQRQEKERREKRNFWNLMKMWKLW